MQASISIGWYVNHYETAVPTFTFNGGATALSGGTSPNLFNQFGDFLLGLPFSRTAQAMTPLLDPDAADPTLPATVRSRAHGLYVRDQWQLNRKMTASVGVRWEYYPFPVRVDRGLEMFRLQYQPDANLWHRRCERAGVHHQGAEDLSRRDSAFAHRRTESIVILALDFRVIRKATTSSLETAASGADVPAAHQHQSVRAEHVFLGGLAQRRVFRWYRRWTSREAPSVCHRTPASSPSIANAICDTITLYNVTMADKLFPHALNVTVGYVANRQRDLVRSQNLNHGQIGLGAASQRFNQPGLANGLRTTSNMNVFRPLGRTDYDSLQLSLTRRMTNGFQFTSAYTYAKATDWLAGNIPIPEFWHLNKAVQGGETPAGASTPHKVDLSAIWEVPVGEGRRFLTEGGVLARIVGGWQLSSSFTAYSGAPFTVTSSAASLNAPGSPQLADQIKSDVEILGGVGPTTPYFDVTAFTPVTEARFGNGSFNSLRGPGVMHIDLSVIRNLAVSRALRLQFRLEAFNITNRPHFANPSNLNVSNLQLNPDGSVRNLNGFGVINTTQNAGREFSDGTSVGACACRSEQLLDTWL